MVTHALTAADFDAVYAAFNEAFSDYVVPFALTREQLQEMITRRGWIPEASAAVFEGERIVAFTLNAIEGTRGYDTGTGVIPTHRRRGLGRETLDLSYELLRAHGVTEYVLEVIEQNERAAAMYLAEGFRVVRNFRCWRYEAQGLTGSEAQRFSPLSLSAFEPLSLDWNILPSWQNTSSSIARAKDAHVVLGDEDGYVVVFPSNGDVPQLAVRRESRRRGVGTRLLRAAAAKAGKPLRIMNVDDSHAGIAAFLEQNGAARTVRQLEMARAL